jgi:D-alanyl-D-alanine carboxypeptidase/D-alanyl-D-alanine-endopeptidase (penicillin-binding protein 4)
MATCFDKDPAWAYPRFALLLSPHQLPLASMLQRTSPILARLLTALILLLTGSWSAAAVAQSPADRAHPLPLPPAVRAALAKSGIPPEDLSLVLTEASGEADPLLRQQATTPVNPASVMKLVTTFAALDLLGPDFTWKTPVLFDGPIDANGILHGNLVIRGAGDPTLVMERLWLLLARVRAQGVRGIDGDILIDRSAFSLPPHDPGAFDGEAARPYNAAPDAFLVNFRSVTMQFVSDESTGMARVAAEPALSGVELPASVPLAPSGTACGDWRPRLRAKLDDPARLTLAGNFPAACGEKSWSVAYADPASYAARAVEAMWRGSGGALTGHVGDGRARTGTPIAFTFESPPLAEVIRNINKFSNNVMAQQVFLTLSAQEGQTASFEASRAVLARWWRERFGAAGTPITDNGAGLSRESRVTADGLARMLQAAWRSALMPDLAASLPLAGIDGTLKRSRAPAGSAHLKTGSLRDVSAVAGFVNGVDGRRWVLVAIVNQPNVNGARPVFDALVDWATRR